MILLNHPSRPPKLPVKPDGGGVYTFPSTLVVRQKSPLKWSAVQGAGWVEKHSSEEGEGAWGPEGCGDQQALG